MPSTSARESPRSSTCVMPRSRGFVLRRGRSRNGTADGGRGGRVRPGRPPPGHGAAGRQGGGAAAPGGAAPRGGGGGRHGGAPLRRRTHGPAPPHRQHLADRRPLG